MSDLVLVDSMSIIVLVLVDSMSIKVLRSACIPFG